MDVDAQAVDQPLVVKPRPARPGKCRRAHRIEPDFARMCGKQISIVRISRRKGEDGLLGRFHAIKRGPDIFEGNLSAAGKAVQVQHDSLDVVVRFGSLEGLKDFGQFILPTYRGLPEEQIARIERLALLHDRAIERKQQRTVLPAARVRT